MEKASVAMDGPDLKQSCPLEWVPQALNEQLRWGKLLSIITARAQVTECVGNMYMECAACPVK